MSGGPDDNWPALGTRLGWGIGWSHSFVTTDVTTTPKEPIFDAPAVWEAAEIIHI